MFTLAQDPILPPVLILPLAAVAMLVTCAHLVWMQRTPMPPTRRRIRTVTGVLSLFTITLTAIGFGVISPDQPRPFLLVWLTVIGLLGILVLLAAIDMANNVRLHAAERKHIRSQLTRLQGELKILAHQRRTRTNAFGLSRDEAGEE